MCDKDIERCKKLTEPRNANWIGISNQKAIAHLIDRIKELEEENAILKKAHNISEKVTIEDITQVMNKSLEDFKKEFIPVQKVKDKIEEIIKETTPTSVFKPKSEWQFWDYERLYKMQPLLELLEGGK